MPLFIKHINPIWGIWKMEETPEELYEMLAYKEYYKDFYESNAKPHRKREWLSVRVLLRELLGEEKPIAYYPNEAPYLPGTTLHIGISHTKEYVAVIISEEKPVGIDIEYKEERIFKVRNRFMSEQEENAISKEREMEHLLVYWCAKEVLFKLIGSENVDFRNHLHIEPFSLGLTGEFTANETRTTRKQTFRLFYDITEDFVLVYGLVK